MSKFVIEEHIEKESREALQDARWLAGHVMQFTRGTVEIDFWVGMIRRSEKFYLHDECTVGKASSVAINNYSNALAILEGIEAYVNGGK